MSAAPLRLRSRATSQADRLAAPVLFLVHFVSTVFMAGLIWFVQVVHYPLFSRVGGDFVSYQKAHMRRTTWVVGPVMLLEAATAAALLGRRPDWLGLEAVWLNLGLLAATWASTALLQVPAHEKLLTGFSRGPYTALVRTNWLRTVLWTVRAAGLTVLLGRALCRSIGEGM